MTTPRTAGPASPPPALPGPREAWLARPYPQLLRGPGYRWWRPLASLGAGALAALVAVALLVGVVTAYYVVDAATGGEGPEAGVGVWAASPEGLLITNVVLAALIPVTMVAVWAGFGWRPRWLGSVVGGIRWSWLAIGGLIAAAAMVIPTVVLAVWVEDAASWKPEPQWPALTAVVVLTTPLQAAGEEYLFRGWLPQAIGSAIRNAWVGGLVGNGVACVLFALAHGQQDPWLFADRFAFGVAAAWLVWQTGGLEASIALHAVNNLTAFGLTIAQGELADAVTVTEADPRTLVLDVATLAIAVLAIALTARARRVVRLFQPQLSVRL